MFLILQLPLTIDHLGYVNKLFFETIWKPSIIHCLGSYLIRLLMHSNLKYVVDIKLSDVVARDMRFVRHQCHRLKADHKRSVVR